MESGLWHDGSIGLGHLMLRTVPESLHETTPHVTGDSRMVVTADARIDNRQELIHELGLGDVPNDHLPDSHLILAAYQKWGTECPYHLLGDYAFALWDLHRRTLLCARDPMGVRPFYYFWSGRTFAFATEIKALFCLSEISRRINEFHVAELLVPTYEDKKSTCYHDVVKLPPAHVLTVNGRNLETARYWSLDPNRELQFSSREECTEAFQELFTEAVRCRLRSTDRVGSTCSGGLDSSSIVCVARRLLNGTPSAPLHTFSGIFPIVAPIDPRVDERPFMQEVIATGDFEAHDVCADQSAPLSEALAHRDEFVPCFGIYLDRALFRAAHQEGVRVLLCGFDGDVTLSYGQEYLEALAERGQWTEFAAVARAVGERSKRHPSHYLRHLGYGHLTKLARRLHLLAFLGRPASPPPCLIWHRRLCFAIPE